MNKEKEDCIFCNPYSNPAEVAERGGNPLCPDCRNKGKHVKKLQKAGFSNIEIVERKPYFLPEEIVKQLLSKEEYLVFKETNVEILSITVKGTK